MAGGILGVRSVHEPQERPALSQEIHYKQLVGQWIDITGVPEGNYIVRVSINTGLFSPIFDEGQNRYPNVIEVPVKVPSPRKKVDIVQ